MKDIDKATASSDAHLQLHRHAEGRKTELSCCKGCHANKPGKQTEKEES